MEKTWPDLKQNTHTHTNTHRHSQRNTIQICLFFYVCEGVSCVSGVYPPTTTIEHDWRHHHLDQDTALAHISPIFMILWLLIIYQNSRALRAPKDCSSFREHARFAPKNVHFTHILLHFNIILNTTASNIKCLFLVSKYLSPPPRV